MTLYYYHLVISFGTALINFIFLPTSSSDHESDDMNSVLMFYVAGISIQLEDVESDLDLQQVQINNIAEDVDFVEDAWLSYRIQD